MSRQAIGRFRGHLDWYRFMEWLGAKVVVLRFFVGVSWCVLVKCQLVNDKHGLKAPKKPHPATGWGYLKLAEQSGKEDNKDLWDMLGCPSRNSGKWRWNRDPLPNVIVWWWLAFWQGKHLKVYGICPYRIIIDNEPLAKEMPSSRQIGPLLIVMIMINPTKNREWYNVLKNVGLPCETSGMVVQAWSFI